MSTLRSMCGPRVRCMYCMDSFACDIEHFFPKVRYPGKAFQWSNLLLCCTHCGRLKGDRLPMNGIEPLIVDPTYDDPWDHLDFEPETGALVPRCMADRPASAKGVETVNALQLDRRESLALGYMRTYRRLSEVVHSFLAAAGPLESGVLVQQLENEDEHGLMAWCMRGNGCSLDPFDSLRRLHPDVWNACEARFV